MPPHDTKLIAYIRFLSYCQALSFLSFLVATMYIAKHGALVGIFFLWFKQTKHLGWRLFWRLVGHRLGDLRR
jgi:hypothetical protein